MKKSLLALAAIGAFAGAAQAQSSVSVYGIVDAGYATVTNTTAAGGSTTGLQSGGMASPRLGFRGVEDTGGGNKVGFVLEAELLTANGSANGIAASTASTQAFSTSQFFNRASYVSMTNNAWGDVKLGLSNTATYDNQVKFDPLKAANLGGYLNASTTVTTATNGAAGTQTQGASRANNAVSYTTPTFMGAQARVITGEAQSATGMNLVSGNVAYARVTDWGLSYTFKALDSAITYRTVSGTAGAAASSTTSAFGSYDLKMVKPYLIYQNSANKTPGVTTQVQGMNFISRMVGLEAPITPVITVAAQYTQNINGNANTAAQTANNSAVGLMGKYALSKRTTLYAIGAFSQNGGAGASITSSSKFSGVTAPVKVSTGSATYQDQQGYMLGINHTF